MKLATRIGALTTAGLMACGSLGAAHADVVEPEPSETAESPESGVDEPTLEAPTEASTEESPDPPPEPTPGASDTPEPTREMECSLIETVDGLVTIEVSDASPGDVVHVGNTAETVNSSSEIQIAYQLGEPLVLKLQQGDEETPALQCEITVNADDEDEVDEESPDEDEENEEDEEPSDEPTGGATDTPEPSPTDPTTTEEPEPSPTETEDPEVPAPSPTTPDETWPEPAPSQPVAPPNTQPAPTSTPDGNDAAPSPPPTPPTDASSGPVERDIRPFTSNPRRLLSQLWGTDSNNGSRLIMPGPRDADETPALETLPPVSEDELNAIKAERASPDRNATGSPQDAALDADVDERLSGTGSWWLLTGIAGLVCLSAGIWWIVARRKPEH
ncbi:hypothetical protein GCM10009720_28540 [Yaniella flava]|uniref:Uncharacterized protein n=1 Tax=Yaniella flava TaxID=287930 RepID=A0ABN2UY13_9MICC|nr:hypothetical protein [Micrococcaceae bacterium]